MQINQRVQMRVEGRRARASVEQLRFGTLWKPVTSFLIGWFKPAARVCKTNKNPLLFSCKKGQ